MPKFMAHIACSLGMEAVFYGTFEVQVTLGAKFAQSQEGLAVTLRFLS